MFSVVGILVTQCPGSEILLCEPVMGEVRSLRLTGGDEPLILNTREKSLVFPATGSLKTSVVGRLRTRPVALSNGLCCVGFADSLKMLSARGRTQVGILMRF